MFLRAGDPAVYGQVAGPAGAPALLLPHSLGTLLHVWDAQADAAIAAMSAFLAAQPA